MKTRMFISIFGWLLLLVESVSAQPLQWQHGGYVQNWNTSLQAISPGGEIFLTYSHNRLLKRSTDGQHFDTIVVPLSLSNLDFLPSGRMVATSSYGIGIGNIDGDSILIRRSGNFGGFRLAILPTGTILMYNGIRYYRTNEAGTLWDSLTFPFSLYSDDGILASPNGQLFFWSRPNGVFRSTNEGTNWVNVTSGFPDSASYHCLAVSPFNGMLYCGTHDHGVYVSGNNGNSWQPMNEGIPIVDIKKIAVDDVGDILICGWGTGVFHYSPAYNNWVSGGFQGPFIDRIGFLPNRNPIVNHSGVYYSTNRGENWCGVGPDTYVEELLAAVDTVFATNQAMYKSTDRGEGWFFTSLAPVDSFAYQSEQYQLAITPLGDLLAGNRFIHRSLDFGRTWDTVYTTTNTNHLIQCFGVSSSSVVLAGSVIDLMSMSYWLRRSLDSGEHWQLTVQLPNLPRSILWLSGSSWLIGLQNGLYRTDDNGLTITQIDPIMDIESLVRSRNGTIYSGGWDGYVRRSNDNGTTWVGANEPLATATVINSLLVLQNGDILAGTSPAGIFRSIDQGNTWSVQNAGLGSTRVYSLVQTNDGIIYAGTELGIYRCENFSRIDEPSENIHLPTRVTLAPVFPNPFNATTTIGYSLPTASYVQVDVVDLLGRTVTQLVREHQTAGSHSIKFTGKDFASGIYFVRLQTGKEILTQKIVLMR